MFCTNRPVAKFHKTVTDTDFLADFRMRKSTHAQRQVVPRRS